MKRYFNEVKLLDSNKITVDEFIRRVMGTDEIDEVIATVAYRIYVEDGGRCYKFNDFAKCMNVRKFPEIELSEFERFANDDKLFSGC